MKKMIKKLSALLLAAVMVLAMSATAFAAAETVPAVIPATASITINHLTPNDGTIVNIYKVVSHDAANSTWVAEPWAEPYVKFPAQNANAEIDWVGLKAAAAAQTPSATKTAGTPEFPAEATSVTFDGLEAGAYLVLATGTTTEYNVMGVPTYKYDNEQLLAPLAATIDAKGTGYKVTKTLNGVETLVHKGQELKYTIDSVFPSFPMGTEAAGRKVSITDMPTGQYVKAVEVFVGGVKLTQDQDYTLSTVLPAKENEEVTVNFTEAYIGTENIHAAQAIKVEVTSVVTDVTTISNNAKGSHDFTPDTTINSDSGSITINKIDKDKNLLAGAKFSITKDPDTKPLEFIAVGDGVYELATADDAAELARVSVLEVGKEGAAKGILVVNGLGEGTYHIKEEKAPDGYSIVEVPDVTLALGETADANIDVINTKLSSLPSTGGIGTTIFTIGGCVIMIVAAGLFFANRRKEEK